MLVGIIVTMALLGLCLAYAVVLMVVDIVRQRMGRRRTVPRVRPTRDRRPRP